MTGVVYLANSSKLGGGNRVLMDIVTGIDRSRFSPLILSPGDGPIVGWAQEKGLPVGLASLVDAERPASGLRLIGQSLRLAARILGARARIVHTMAQTCYRPAGLAGLITGARRICHLGFPPAPGELEWLFRFGPEAVVGCYEGQAKEVSEEVRRASPKTRVLAIPNGVDTDVYSPATPATPANPKWRFGARRVVLIVGHLSDVKGYPEFLEAARIVGAKVKDCAFVALGGETITKGYLAKLEEKSRELGITDRVHFLGWRSEVPEILRSADIMVLPSLAEGLPLAVLEAMACGLPVVASNVGGVPEAIQEGTTGFLVPAKSPTAVAQATLRLLEDNELARRMGKAGRARVESSFSVRRLVKEVERLYDELIAA